MGDGNIGKYVYDSTLSEVIDKQSYKRYAGFC